MGRTGSLLFGFVAGSALTAAAAYVAIAHDLKRLQKEKRRLEQELEQQRNGGTGVTTQSRSTALVSTSSAAAVAAAGEHVGFLTDIMKQLWIYVKVAGADSIKETVEPMFKDMMPAGLGGLHFTKIDLGSVPIRMDNVVVHKLDHKTNTLQFDLDLVWDGTYREIILLSLLLNTGRSICCFSRQMIQHLLRNTGSYSEPLFCLFVLFVCLFLVYFGQVIVTFNSNPAW